VSSFSALTLLVGTTIEGLRYTDCQLKLNPSA